MNRPYTLTGGARIGMANASFPFASLYVDPTVLKINASIIGHLVFQPKDIISIQPFTSFPIVGRGIKITHRVANYSSEVIFWTLKNPNTVLTEIEKTGFLSNTSSDVSAQDLEILKQQQEGGFPIKKSAVLFYIAAWNILFLTDIIPSFFYGKTESPFHGAGIPVALGLVFFSSLLVLISKSFQKLILKENCTLASFKKFVYFLAFISGILCIAFSLGYLNS
jgi:hypothetical protein